MVLWRVTGASLLLMAIGLGMPIAGIIGSWLLFVGAEGYRREVLPLSLLFTFIYLAPVIYVSNLALALALKVIVLIILIIASMRLRDVISAMSLKKINKYMEWGAKLIVGGAFLYVIYIGAFIMAIGLLLAAYGALIE